MARERSPNRDKAYEVYRKHKGKIKNKEIAEILNEDPKTISKWKTLDEWESRLNNSKNRSRNSKFENNKKYGQDDVFQGDVFNELNEIVENVELSEKQVLFCIYYIKSFNAAKAYQKAYGCSLTAAYANGSRLLGNDNIRMTIMQLKQNRLNQAMLSPEDIFQKYMDIAFADITDYISFGKKDTLIGLSKDGVPIYEKNNYIDFKESDEVDGTLITEFKEGKNGFSIKLMDRIKAMNWISEHMYMATEEQKARIDHLRNKIRVDNEMLEIKRKLADKDDW